MISVPMQVKFFNARVESAAGSLIVGTDGSFSGIASAEIVDMVGDVMVADGCVTRGPDVPLLVQHDRNNLVGRAKLLPQAGVVRAFAKFAPLGTSQVADQWRQLVAAGVATDLSIGFVELEGQPIRGGGRRITKWLCKELSVVTIGANPVALIGDLSGSQKSERDERLAELNRRKRQYAYEVACADVGIIPTDTYEREASAAGILTKRQRQLAWLRAGGAVKEDGKTPSRFLAEAGDFELVQRREFDESQHPRGDDGRFIGSNLSKDELKALAPNLGKIPSAARIKATTAMHSWVGEDYMYRKINSALRDQSSYLSPAIKSKIDGLDTIFKLAAIALKKDTLLYRGVRNIAFSVGMTYLDRGFQSTSSNRFIANAFIPSDSGTLLSIVARAGTRVFAPHDQTGQNLESEVLLNRDTRFKILKVSDRNVHAEIV